MFRFHLARNLRTAVWLLLLALIPLGAGILTRSRLLDQGGEAAVEAFREGRQADAAALHTVERWREELVAEDEALTRWMAQYPDTDLQHLRTLIRNARRTDHGAHPSERHSRAWRELFKAIRDRLNAATRADGEVH